MKLFTINATSVRSVLSATENRKRIREYPSAVGRVLSEFGIDGCTITKVSGYWGGTQEVSFKIEVATDESATTIKRVCARLRDEFEQEAVMLTYPNNTAELI